MTDRAQMAITAATALILGATSYADTVSLNPHGLPNGIRSGAEAILFLLALFGVFLVNRWWALLPA